MIFGFGKKKGNTDGQSSVFNDFGMKTNDVTETTGRESRKSAARTAEAGRISTIKKDNLLEKISDLFQIGYTDANGFMHVLDEELPFD